MCNAQKQSLSYKKKKNVEGNFIMNPVFLNTALAIDVNIISISKIDIDLKSVIENIVFVFLCFFKNAVIGWKY